MLHSKIRGEVDCLSSNLSSLLFVCSRVRKNGCLFVYDKDSGLALVVSRLGLCKLPDKSISVSSNINGENRYYHKM